MGGRGVTRGRPHPLRRVLRWVLGWVFIVLGVAGLFLPILQGILFLCIGVWLLSLASPRVRLLRIRLGRRYPAFRRQYEAARAWVRRRTDGWRRRETRA